jgi:hypothetical protein
VAGKKGRRTMTDPIPLEPVEVKELTVSEDRSVVAWDGAATQGLKAKRERDAIIKEVLNEGTDFGKIPGVDKPSLLNPGMQKIMDCLGLYAEYEVMAGTLEDWDRPLFNYTYRCTLRQRGTGFIVATGIGSCNSMENRYRWRTVQIECPDCGKQAVIKGKKEYGGGWLCWGKKGGCGTKWDDAHGKGAGWTTEKVENDDIYTQVNTMQKMGQKRAKGAAVLDLGFADVFTQDVEDSPASFGDAKKTTKKGAKKTPPKPPAEIPNPWTGKMLESPGVHQGTSKAGKPYTLYILKCAGDVSFSTFDEGIAETADQLRNEGTGLCITWEAQKSGRLTAKEIGPVNLDTSEIPFEDDDRPPIDSDDA